ncbi:MAG: T9SS type A sorting domain-containing protein [Crocinitomicaceae bacterium]|nr:T9SS type A sorting domain-containing protein [Crocinitomicaceae bacterium]|tara:strand:- start:1722 stop:2681 length:960 start_codon:yes stop_codon:yes gene_type:complete
MKKTLLILSAFVGTFTMAQDCSELFISEYVEGVSNNKALEIYNPTGADIDLSQYIVIRYSNGSTSATPANAVALVGMIPSKAVHVAVLEKLDPAGTGQEAPIWDSLQARADAFYCPEYNTSNAFYWNGNDAVALAKGSIGDIGNAVLVDLFGKLGEDPGEAWTSDFPYTGAGDVVTKDHSLIRNPGVLTGQINPTIAYFDPLLEYDSIPALITIGGQLYGNWDSLGEHTCDCATAGIEEQAVPTKVSVFPNPSNAEFFVNGAANYPTLVVVNSLGQEVRKIEKNTSAIVSFDLEGRRGVYFLKLSSTDGSTVTRRVIIK